MSRKEGHKDFEAIANAIEWSGGFVSRLVRTMRAQEWSAEEICAIITKTDPNKQPFEQIVSNMHRFPSQIYAPDWIPDGCKVLDDVGLHDYKMENLEWLPVLDAEKFESYLWGETMRERAKAWDANPGLSDGKLFFWEHRDELPRDMAIPLTGTLLFDKNESRLRICQLYRENGGPLLQNYPVLAFGWYRQHHLPRIKRASKV